MGMIDLESRTNAPATLIGEEEEATMTQTQSLRTRPERVLKKSRPEGSEQSAIKTSRSNPEC